MICCFCNEIICIDVEISFSFTVLDKRVIKIGYIHNVCLDNLSKVYGTELSQILQKLYYEYEMV